MTDQSFPITPPLKLVEQWLEQSLTSRELAAKAFQAGADQELEACIDVILAHPGLEHPELLVEVLRGARRPKPPSLKEQALAVMQKLSASGYPCDMQQSEDWDTIRRALEALPE